MRYKSRTEFVCQNLNKIKGFKKILDIGFVGNTDDEPFIHNKIKETISTTDFLLGIDINADINQFKEQNNVKYRELSIYDLDGQKDLKSFFHAVVFCEVIEHLPFPYLAIEKISWALRTGGKLIITYPNPLGYRIFLSYLLKSKYWDPKFAKYFAGDPDHKVFPMPPSLVHFLNVYGFEVEECAFPKGAFAGVPILEKFSTYVGIVAKKI